jgi:hypothetical protein
MRIRTETVLDCAAQRAWELIIQVSTTCQISLPLLRLEAAEGTFPALFTEKSTLLCRPYLHGRTEMPVRTIFCERVDSQAMFIQTRESDRKIATWDHLMRVTPIPSVSGQSRCLYLDEVEIQAGLSTMVVAAWAKYLYRHRQRRLQELAKAN